jgi:hypothetical protein
MTEHRMLLWRGPEPQRIDTAYVGLETDSLTAHGTSLTSSYALDFHLTTGPRWITRELDVRTRGDGWWRSLVLRRSGDGEWTADWAGGGGGELPQALPDVQASLDCDLGLCPLTNTMPILRHDLVGAAHRRERASYDFLMAWVSVPDLAVHRSDQRYTVSDPVEEGGGAMVGYASERFSTTLEVDADGLVVNYPGLGRRLEFS